MESRSSSHSLMPVPIFVSFQKKLVLQAVQKDQEGERSAALSLYCSALEHFVPAIHCKSSNHTHILSACLTEAPQQRTAFCFSAIKQAK